MLNSALWLVGQILSMSGFPPFPEAHQGFHFSFLAQTLLYTLVIQIDWVTVIWAISSLHIVIKKCNVCVHVVFFVLYKLINS